MNYKHSYVDEKILLNKLAIAENKLKEKKELYRSCIKDPKHKEHWEHYKDENECAWDEIRKVNELKEQVYFMNLPEIDQKIYNAEWNIELIENQIQPIKR